MLATSFSNVKASEVDTKLTPEQAPELAQIGSWDFAISFGAGIATNPVRGGDHLPMVIIPSVRYYDQNLFFDNGVLGYTLVDRPRYAISMINKVNFNAAYFERWQAGNILASALVSDGSGGMGGIFGGSGESSSQNITLDINDLAKRRWSIDSGLQVNWFFSPSFQLLASYYLDSSGVHHGESAQLEISKRFTINKNTYLTASTGVNWQSQQVNNYYYGISERDVDMQALHFVTTDSLSPFLKVAMLTKLSAHWRFVLSAKVNQLGNAISDSPIVDESRSYVGFIGLRYDF